jgi:iron complex outermembrane receptor protein
MLPQQLSMVQEHQTESLSLQPKKGEAASQNLISLHKFNFNSAQRSGCTFSGGIQVISEYSWNACPDRYHGNASTDWQKEIYDNAFTTDNNLSVSGAYKFLPYRVSLGYLNQDGILKTGNLKRKSAAITLNPRLLDDHLKIDLNLKGSISNSRFANEGAIGNAVRFDPTQPVHSGDKRFGGYFEWRDANSTTGLRSLAPLNPVGQLEQRSDESDVIEVSVMFSLIINYIFCQISM